jgi:sorbose reductase
MPLLPCRPSSHGGASFHSIPAVRLAGAISLRCFHSHYFILQQQVKYPSTPPRPLYSSFPNTSLPTIKPIHIKSYHSSTMAGSAMKGGNFAHNNTEPPQETKVLPLFSLKGKTAIVSGAGAVSVSQLHKALQRQVPTLQSGITATRRLSTVLPTSSRNTVSNVTNPYLPQSFCEHLTNPSTTSAGKAYQVNVQDPAKVDEAIKSQVAEFNNRLDIFVANSGIPWTQGAMIDGEIDHYHKVVSTDLDGTFYCARSCGAAWREQKKNNLENFKTGSFIAAASMSGHVVNIPQLQAAYNAAKAGVIHLCRSLAVEWVQFARANSVSPGYMATEISDFITQETKDIWKDKIPMGRKGEAHGLKGAYLYLASDASSYMSGADLIVDGAYHCH